MQKIDDKSVKTWPKSTEKTGIKYRKVKQETDQYGLKSTKNLSKWAKKVATFYWEGLAQISLFFFLLRKFYWYKKDYPSYFANMKYHRPLISVEKNRIRFKVGKSFDEEHPLYKTSNIPPTT